MSHDQNMLVEQKPLFCGSLIYQKRAMTLINNKKAKCAYSCTDTLYT